MAAVTSFLTPERFEEIYTDDRKPYFEYWFGEAVQKPVPTRLHSIMQLTLGALLLSRGCYAASELRLKVSKIAYPVPDLVAGRRPFQGEYPSEPPDLCVEILSPGDTRRKVFNKCAHYLDWGIGLVWIVDPEKRTAYQMSLKHPQPLELDISGTLTAGGGQVVLPVSELFAEFGRNLG